MFQFCPRAAYLHYYAAQGGWDAGAGPARRELFKLKHLRTVESWTRNILDTAFNETFITAREPGVSHDEQLFRTIQRIFYRGRTDYRLRQWEKDPKYLNLVEIYCFGEDEKAVFERAMLLLENTFAVLIDSDCWRELLAVASLGFWHKRKVSSFSLNELQCFVSPLLVWRHAGGLKMLCNNAENFQTACLNSLFTAAVCRNPAATCETVFLTSNGISSYTPDKVEINEFKQLLLPEVTKLAELHEYAVNGVADKFSPDLSNCPRCRFALVCDEAEKKTND